ncbi:MAG TPA: UxaA family hydrolase [Microvirga sp.]|jgi:altronate dehydratase large subunit|nr:UxaA family hydrolase [Microvirga sp.]
MIQGYRRPDGSFGIRNHLLVLGINGLALRAAEKIARGIAGAVCVATVSGRGQVEPDLGLHLDQLVGLGCNPNAGAVLVVGVDDETTQGVSARIAATGMPVQAVSFAEAHEDVLAVVDLGTRRAAALARLASRVRRESVPVAGLTVGIECGHSDATSGLVSNPVVGGAIDALVDHGGTAIIGETVEWLGAEHLLARRARIPQVGDAIVAAVRERERMAAASGRSLTGNNPGEENIRGGLSTIEEKSLGAIVKSGTRPVDGVLQVAERPQRPGLYVMDGPAFSPDSITGFAASGAQVVVFTTGPGNSYASALAPTVKVSAQPDAVRRLAEQIDFDASAALTGGQPIAALAERLFETILDVAEGTLTFGEILGEGLEVPTRIRGSL